MADNSKSQSGLCLKYIKDIDYQFYQIYMNQNDGSGSELDYSEEGSNISELFELLYTKSHEEKFHWRFCSFDAYSESVDSRLHIFRKSGDLPDKYFWEKEKDNLDQLLLSDLFVWFNDDYQGFMFYLTDFLEKEMILKLKYSHERKSDFIEAKIRELSKPLENGIFSNQNAYELFCYLKDNFDSEYLNSDISYIFWKMYNYGTEDSEILCSQEDFIKYCYQKFGITISRLLNRPSDKREKKYRALLNSFPMKNRMN